MRISRRAAVVLALLSLFAPQLAAVAQDRARTRAITAEDYYAFEFLGDPRISPGGKWVAYVVTTIDQKQNRRLSQIWLAPTDGSRPPRQLTTSPQSSNSPRWSPDGRTLAFLSSRPSNDTTPPQGPAQSNPATQSNPQGTSQPAQTSTQTSPAPASSPTQTTATTPGVSSAQQTASADSQPRAQVWALSLEGGEAKRLTNLKNGVNNFDWSPDSTRLVLTTRTGPSDIKAPSSDVRHYKHTSYKFNDTGWFDDKRSHIWVVDVQTGAARQITSGEDWNDSDP